ncbi:MAG: T9SS type A sorting domain-containing protein [Bacteroidia bacterium]
MISANLQGLIRVTSILIFCLAFTGSGYSQNILWEKNYGGSSSENIKFIQQTPDGGYIAAGESASNDIDVSRNYGSNDYWVVKLDSSLTIEWEQNYGGSNNDIVGSLTQSSDGGYVIAGESRSSSHDVSGNFGFSDYWVIKIDSSGSIQWEQNYGGSFFDHAADIQLTNDGGYVVAGNSRSSSDDVSNNYGNRDYWVVKLDSVGGIDWEQNYGGSGEDHAESIIQAIDGGYVVAGWTSSSDTNVSANYGQTDYWIAKLDSSGNLEWEQNYGGSQSEIAYEIRQTMDGGYIMAGHSISSDNDVSGNHGNFDYWVVKISDSGIIEWEQNYGGFDIDNLHSVAQSADGGYILAGRSSSNSNDVSGNYGGSDIWIVKLDDAGSIQWEKNYGGSDDDEAYSIQQTIEGNYIVAGRSRSDDFDVSGNNGTRDIWVFILEDTTTGCTIDTSVSQNNNMLTANASGATYQWVDCELDYNPITGENNQSFTAPANGEYAVIITDSTCTDTSACFTITGVGIEDGANSLGITVYPNPTEGKITVDHNAEQGQVEIRITNSLGQVVSENIFVSPGIYDIELAGQSGIYFIHISNEKSERTTIKVFKQ